MVKGKVGKEALKKLSKTKFARGAGIAGGAKVAEEAVSNPYAQAALGAAEGAALGAALGPWGAAGGAVAGLYPHRQSERPIDDKHYFPPRPARWPGTGGGISRPGDRRPTIRLICRRNHFPNPRPRSLLCTGRL